MNIRAEGVIGMFLLLRLEFPGRRRRRGTIYFTFHKRNLISICTEETSTKFNKRKEYFVSFPS